MPTAATTDKRLEALSILVPTLFVAILGIICANAWSNLAQAYFRAYEERDPKTGQVVSPLTQMLVYALSVTAVTVVILGTLHSTGLADLRQSIATD